MYKVFFNDRVVYLTDEQLPEFKDPDAKVVAFEDRMLLGAVINEVEKGIGPKQVFIYHTNLKQLKKAFKAFFKKVKAAGGLVVNKEGEYLGIRRRGIWDLPKGKKQKGEKIKKTAVREVSEEAGIPEPEIKAKITTTRHTYRERNRLVLKTTKWYLMEHNSDEKGTPEVDEEISEVRWFDEKELGQVVVPDTYLSITDVIKKAGLL